MTAYSRLQENEIRSEAAFGYEAVKHQRVRERGYCFQLQQIISGGLASTMALKESTEAEQFGGSTPLLRPEHDTAAGQPILGDCPDPPVRIEIGPEEMLLPSGD